MENKREWKVVMFGEGQDWEHKPLTYEEAQEIIKDCPDEYVAFIAPILPGFDY